MGVVVVIPMPAMLQLQYNTNNNNYDDNIDKFVVALEVMLSYDTIDYIIYIG